MSWHIALALGLLCGYALGAGTVILLTYHREKCNHQWETIESGTLCYEDRYGKEIDVGKYYIDRCRECGEIKMRKWKAK